MLAAGGGALDFEAHFLGLGNHLLFSIISNLTGLVSLPVSVSKTISILPGPVNLPFFGLNMLLSLPTEGKLKKFPFRTYR